MNSSMKFLDRVKGSVTYKNNKFKCIDPDCNNFNFTYNCIHKECGAYIVLDREKSKITSSNLEHMNHHPTIQLRPRLSTVPHLKTHKVKTTVPQPKITPNSSNSKPKNKTRVSFSVNVINDSPLSDNKNSDIKNVPGNKAQEVTSHQTRDASSHSQPVSLPVPSIEPTIPVPTDTIQLYNHRTVVDTARTSCNSSLSDTVSSGAVCSIVTAFESNARASVKIPSTVQKPRYRNKCSSTSSTQTHTNLEHVSFPSMEREKLLKTVSRQAAELESLRNQIEILEAYIEAKHNQYDHAQNRVRNPSPVIPQVQADFTCHIIGDSHVRGLAENLQPILPKGCHTQSFFQPGAGFHGVAAAHSQSPSLITPAPNDTVVIMCGTNDVCTSQWPLIQKALESLITKFQHCKCICIVGVPMRLDNKKLNYHITRFNIKIKSFVKTKCANPLFIDLFKLLKRHDLARDGIHLNKGGKHKLCNKIKSILLKDSANTGSSNRPPLSEIISPDLIVLHSNEDTTVSQLHSVHDSNRTLSEPPILDISHGCNSHINTLLLNNPNHYRLTNVSVQSFSNAVHSSPIPGFEPHTNPNYYYPNINNPSYSTHAHSRPSHDVSTPLPYDSFNIIHYPPLPNSDNLAQHINPDGTLSTEPQPIPTLCSNYRVSGNVNFHETFSTPKT
uniref:Uncharacterized protein n=1 Tax=Cacopsylla melanoneura TaxID=428564 RepID=A0A8D8RX99_9HEMI